MHANRKWVSLHGRTYHGRLRHIARYGLLNIEFGASPVAAFRIILQVYHTHRLTSINDKGEKTYLYFRVGL